MGKVHEAIDATLDRPVALKVLRQNLAKDPHQLARLEREARAVARLAHPNVVVVTELVRDEELGPLLVMELLSGVSLAERLVSGPLDETETVSVFMQALDGLAAAQAAGMVHRDLKPSNIVLVPIASGVLVKVLDFGIVKLAEQGAMPKLTRHCALIGTPAYMSPEQITCEPVDARSDVYSMGACLYEALCGQPPYDGSHPLEVVAAVNEGPPPDLREIDRAVSPDLAHIARVAMSRDPSGRYQSAKAMREALRGATTDRRARGREPGGKASANERAALAAMTIDRLPLESRRRPLAVLLVLVRALRSRSAGSSAESPRARSGWRPSRRRRPPTRRGTRSPRPSSSRSRVESIRRSSSASQRRPSRRLRAGRRAVPDDRGPPPPSPRPHPRSRGARAESATRSWTRSHRGRDRDL